MKFDDDYESSDVEDRRGQRVPFGGGGGGGGGGLGLLAQLVWRLGWKGGLVVFGLLAVGRYFMGGLSSSTQPAVSQQHAGHDRARAFVGYVLDDVQKTWAQRLPGYKPARVVLYSDATTTGCGLGQAAVGPFYCPRDEHVYLDVTFFNELHNRFGVKGDFAQAYVIAHELGHHLQRLDGTSDKVERAPATMQRGESGQSVRLKLQADCYAGVWARSAEQRGLLEPGDIASAIQAAQAIGDDRLQQQAGGTVEPEQWTHGSSAERVHWFQRGHDSGEPAACDTFHAAVQ